MFLSSSQTTQLDWHTGYVLVGRGQARGRAGDYRGGIADLRTVLALKLSAGTARYQIMALDLLGDLVADLGEHERALGLREQALRLARVSAAHSHPGPAARLVRHQRRGFARSE